MTWVVEVVVQLKPVVNDPQGLVVRDGLRRLGFTGVRAARIGKHVELEVEADSEQDARESVAWSGPSLKGGFQKANSRSPRGLPSTLTGVNGTPTRRSARSSGLPIVADVRMNLGSDP